MRCILAAFLLIASLPVVADVFEEAEWLRDPRMKGQEVRDYYGRKPSEKSPGPWNQHTLFRKEISLKQAPKQAVLWITGDDYYKFSINGEPVVQGPEAGYPFAHPYYYLDVTPYLHEGVNVLATHSYYQGLVNRVWNSGDNRSGFICRLQVLFEDGRRAEFVTDKSWRCFPLEAYQGMETAGYDTQFLENIDLRQMPVGWEKPKFRERKWVKPLLGRQDHVFSRQITPPLQVYRREPRESKAIEGGMFYDFGTEVVGALRLRVRGKAGEQVIVRHAEELDEAGRARYGLRAGAVYEETCTLTGGEDIVAFYDYKGFRYVEVLGQTAPLDLWVEARHHPWPEGKTSFQSSDKNLAAIWELCRNSVQWGAQGVFVDCPTREKGQYLGDTVIAARAHLWLTGDASLTRKALTDFANSRHIHPALTSIAPGNTMQEIADFSLQYPILLREYYRHTGDRSFADLMATAVLPDLLEHFRQFENADGLLENYGEKTTIIDWPLNLRDDYDLTQKSPSIITILNAFYYGALRAAADLTRELGRESLLYERRAQRVAEAFPKYLVNPDTGLYVDAAGSKHSSLHANALPLAFGLSGGADTEKVLALIREKRLSCGVYFASYVIEACFRGGDPALGYELITSQDQNSWSQMLRNGATTTTETWVPEQKNNMSWCHPWGSSPIYLLAEGVFGLSRATAGWQSIQFAPAAIPNLPEMELVVPHPQGQIRLTHTPGKGFDIAAPPGVEVVRPAASPATRVAGKARRALGMLNAAQQALLKESGWDERVGEKLGVWVDVKTQMMYILEGMKPVWQAPTGTASAGTGSTAGSYKTPLGWHVVDEKFGEKAPWGQVFRSRGATREIWKPGMDVKEDMVLTRILWLEGLEPGKNKGRNAQGVSVDSKARCIYIHGTNGEHLIGTPSSHGCIRLLNDDVIEAFERIPKGTLVLITE